jgi:uncharacterized protein YjbI with pentapeptide repeats
MANEEHLQIIRQGVDAWNAWREKNPQLRPDLFEANLSGLDLSGADLSEAILTKANLSDANLLGANLCRVKLYEANLSRANLTKANLSDANLHKADLTDAILFRASLSEASLLGANLSKADLRGGFLFGANLSGANLCGAKLHEANLHKADLSFAGLSAADLTGAFLHEVNLLNADLTGAFLTGANLALANLAAAQLSEATLNGVALNGALLLGTDLRGASIAGSSVYGASVWDIKVDEHTKQQNLIITAHDQPAVTVDNIKVAQFIYLLLTNKEIRDVIDTIGKKGVLLLGRFTGGRIAVLERIREELRKRDFLPMVFNFDKPEAKDFTETVRLLAGLSHFVIADITNPRAAPLELQAIVPDYMIPFVPILEQGEEPFSMFIDLWIKYREWVLDPIRYPSVDRLIEVLDTEIVRPAQARFAELLAKKAEKLRVKDI